MTELSQSPAYAPAQTPISHHPSISFSYTWDYLRTNGLLFLADAMGFSVAILLALVLEHGLIGYPGFTPVDFLALIPSLGPILCLAFLFFGLYPATGIDAFTEFRKISIATTLVFASFLLVSTSDYTSGLWLGPQWVVAWLLSVALILASRSLLRPVFARYLNWGYRSVLIGDRDNIARILPALHTGRHWVRIVKVLEQDQHLNETLQQAQAQDIHWAVVVSDRRNLPESTRRLIARFSNLVMIAPVVGGGKSSLTFQSPTGIVPVVHNQNRLRIPPHPWLKRCLDVLLSLAVGLALLPMLLFIAGAIRLSSPGPIFYSQQRIGRGGQPFRIWKFRTMVTDADEKLAAYLAAHPELRQEWEQNQKLLQDPRITRIGRVLRTTSLDELPQLWNVLIGEMSFIGPRPIVTEEKQRYDRSFDFYQQVAPGITGLWQISGRNTTSYSFRIALDDFYVRNWSLWLDLYILLCTIKVVIRKEGAC